MKQVGNVAYNYPPVYGVYTKIYVEIPLFGHIRKSTIVDGLQGSEYFPYSCLL